MSANHQTYSRRQYLVASGLVASASIAGCTGSSDEEDSNSGSDDVEAEETTTTTEPEPEPETLVDDETVWDQKRYPEDLKEGDALHITAEVQEGGPMIYNIHRAEGDGDPIARGRVDTDDEFDVEIEEDGLHYIMFAISDGHAYVTVTKTPA